jgi:hypothetical protein
MNRQRSSTPREADGYATAYRAKTNYSGTQSISRGTAFHFGIL